MSTIEIRQDVIVSAQWDVFNGQPNTLDGQILDCFSSTLDRHDLVYRSHVQSDTWLDPDLTERID